MFRLLLVGLWATGVTLGATYGGVYWRLHKSAPQHEAENEKVEVHKARPLTVPIIADGALKGYISAEFSFIAPKADGHGKEKELDPESFFLDEAFRLIYAESKIDFSNIQKSDLNELTVKLTENVNRRLGKPVIKETLLRNLTFIGRDELPK